MSDSNNNKIESIDKIIIFIIFFIFMLAILGTIWWVNYKRRIEINNLINTYNRIQYSNYKYKKEDKTIYFYKDAEHISKYKCIQNCFIDELQPEQFVFANEDLIYISEGTKFIIYNAKTNKKILVLDEFPKATTIKEYGIITNNNKKGIIDETGKIISDFQYDNISTIDNYIITYLDGNIYVYDNTMKLLDMEKTNTNNIDDLVLLSNEEKITIIITTQNSSISNIYKYNKKENNFIK